MKVLLADDETLARRSLQGQLERLGCAVSVAANGTQAWAMLNTRAAPRLVFLDWNMPDLSGTEICSRVRERQTGSYTYLVLVTARTAKQDLVEGLESGADDFLPKPVSSDELRARLHVAERVLNLESRLQRTNAYLEAVLAHIDSGAMLSDPDGKIVYVNPVMERVFGIGAQKLLGTQREEFLESRGIELRTDEEIAVLGAEIIPQRPGVAHDERLPSSSGRFELAGPRRRVMSWFSQAVPLGDRVGSLELCRDVTTEVDHQRTLEHLVITDHRLGLLNRRGGERAIAREFSLARQQATSLSFAMIDIDHFKTLNDRYGHAMGDRVLEEVARQISCSIRGRDVAVRWGGEEFLLVLPLATRLQAYTIVERVRGSIAALDIDGVPRTTVSIGVSELTPEDVGFESAVERADKRLYEAKQAGRNMVR